MLLLGSITTDGKESELNPGVEGMYVLTVVSDKAVEAGVPRGNSCFEVASGDTVQIRCGLTGEGTMNEASDLLNYVVLYLMELFH